MSNELSTRPTEEALIAASKGEAVQTDLVIPMLKVGQGLTKEVAARDAQTGDFINALSGETYGRSIEFLIVKVEKARAWKDRDADMLLRSQPGVTEVPWDNHPEKGTPFVDALDAEERFKALVNSGQKEWGSGPGIRTTYNFTGYVLVDGEIDPVPVVASLGAAPAAEAKAGRELMTLVQLSRAPWDNVYTLSTADATSKRGHTFARVAAKKSRQSTPEERQAAVDLAGRLYETPATVVGDEDAAPSGPSSTGGLAV